MGVVKIHVVYCGAWGYAPKFRRLQDELERKFNDQVKITGEGTPEVTGFFEVTVNDTLVHSKKNGDGYVDSDAKKNKIFKAVEDFIAKSWSFSPQQLLISVRMQTGSWGRMSTMYDGLDRKYSRTWSSSDGFRVTLSLWLHSPSSHWLASSIVVSLSSSLLCVCFLREWTVPLERIYPILVCLL